jgi:hypothetical protein
VAIVDCLIANWPLVKLNHRMAPPSLSDWTFQWGLLSLSCPWSFSPTFYDYHSLFWWDPSFVYLGKVCCVILLFGVCILSP